MRDEVSLKKNFSSHKKRRFLIDDMKMKQDCIENHELNKKIHGNRFVVIERKKIIAKSIKDNDF